MTFALWNAIKKKCFILVKKLVYPVYNMNNTCDHIYISMEEENINEYIKCYKMAEFHWKS